MGPHVFLTVTVLPVPSTHLLIGVDAGASKTHLLAGRLDSAACTEHRGPGANPNRIGMEQAADVLADLVGDAVREYPSVEQLSICAGVAGAGHAREQEILAEALHTALSSSDLAVRVEVVHDAVIALDAAYDAGSGLVVVAGTGSVVLARTTDGQLLRSGGWGHVLGDAGSGSAIGRAGLRAVAEALDGGKDTSLRTRVREHCGITNRESLVQKVYQGELNIQTVAPLVINTAVEGDVVAANILSTQITRLAEQVEWLLNRGGTIAPRITLLGGMLQNEYYTQCLRRVLEDSFPNWAIGVLQKEPAVGALRRAGRPQSKGMQ